MSILIFILILIIFYLAYKRYREKQRMLELIDILKEVEGGNYARRAIVPINDRYSDIYYIINKIIRKNQDDIIHINKMNQQNKILLTNLSHDIKTPIASLLGYLEAIERGLVDSDEVNEYFHIALNKTYDLKEYIDELFQLLQLESGEYTIERKSYNICEETRKIFISWIPILEEHKIKYKVCIPDKKIIRNLDIKAYCRILDNLIKNAVVHSKCTEISIILKDDELNIQVIIKDNGIGIPESSKDMIIDRLYKVNQSRNSKGHGLGLAIVKELADKMDILIKYESEVGTGSSFVLDIKA